MGRFFLFMASYFSLIRTIIGHFCLFLAWTIPDIIPPWDTFHHEFAIVTGIFLLMPWKKMEALPLRITALMLLWCCYIILQIRIHGLQRDDVAFGLIFAGLFCMAALQGAQAIALVQGKELTHPTYSIRSWCHVILIAGVASAIIGLAQWTNISLGLWMTESAGRAYANFAQPNHLATLLVMAFAALIYLDNETFPRTAIYGFAILLCSALAVTESRTGALSFALLCILTTVWGPRANLNRTLHWLLPSFLLFAAIYTNLSQIAPLFGGTALRSGIGLDPTGRIEIWHQMFAALRAEPWVGYGWLQLGASHFKIAFNFDSLVNVDHAHNLLLDLLIWFGIPMGGIFILAGGVLSVRMVSRALGSKMDHQSLCLVAMLLPIGVHSMLEYPYAYLYFSLVAGFFAGALEAKVFSAYFPSIHYRQIFQIIATASIALCILIAFEYYRVEEDYRAMRLENQFITRPEELHKFHSHPIILTQYGDLVASQRNDLQAPSESRAVDVTRRLTLRFPWLSTHLHYYITLLQKNHCQEANEQWKIYEALFGRFGELKADESIAKLAIKSTCQGIPHVQR